MLRDRTFRRPTRPQFVHLLAATTVAVYATIALGAAAASRATAGCSQWPLCLPASSAEVSADLLLSLGHRVSTAVAGILLLATVLAAIRIDLDRRARLALLGGAVAFPAQIGIGALVALTDLAYAAELHLVAAAAVFMLLVTALGWTLESGATDDGTPTPGDGGAKDPPVTDGDAEPSGSVGRVRAYLELTKPRLMWLLCLLALAGIALATVTTGRWPSGVTVAATLGGGVLAIGASGTFNHLFERGRDKRMERTADRPVATDRIPARNAAAFGIGLAALSMAVLVSFVNALAAALTLVAIVYYSVVYTVVLKPNTTWNISIGGGAGALPGLIGWVAVTGSIGLGGLALAALVVAWTPAHFYNLAIAYRDDYARGGYPMLPVVAGVSVARRRILLTLGGTLLVTAALVAVTPLGLPVAVVAILAGAGFLATVVSQCRTRTREATLRSFYASNAYLGAVLAAIGIEALLLLS